MRRFLIVLFCLYYLGSQAQYITIPDQTLRNQLWVAYPSAFNSSIQMDTTNVAITTANSLSLYGPINNYEGIQYFDNLHILSINNIDQLPQPVLVPYLVESYWITNYTGSNNISLPGRLKFLSIKNSSNFTTINSFSEGLEKIVINNCNTLDHLPTLPPSLLHLEATFCGLNSLPILPLGLLDFDISDNVLQQLPLLPSSLTSIRVDNNDLASLPTLPENLITFYAAGNQLASLPALPISLRIVDVSFNQLSIVPSLPSLLTDIFLSNNQIESLPPFPNTLENVDVSHNLLTELPDLTPALLQLYCYDNKLAEIPPLPRSLFSLGCANNKIKQLPSLPDSLSTLGCNGNPLKCLPYLNSVFTLNIAMEDSVKCLPNEPPQGYMIQLLHGSNIVNSFASYNNNPYPVCDLFNNLDGCHYKPYVEGKIYYDENNNALFDLGETVASNIKIQGPGNTFTFSNNDGYYRFEFPSLGAQSLTLMSPEGFSSLPASRLFQFNSYDTMLMADFALRSSNSHDSLSLSLTALPASVPENVRMMYEINCQNLSSNQKLTSLILEFDHTKLIFDSASVEASSVTDSTITWQPFLISPLATQNLRVYLHMVPLVTEGTEISATAKATSGNVMVKDSVDFVVENSNNMVKKTATDSITKAQPVSYRFIYSNNTAIPVKRLVISDTLSSKLEPAELQFMASNPNCNIQLNGNVLQMIFNDKIPSSNTDYYGSFGYVYFRVKATPSIMAPDSILNAARFIIDSFPSGLTNTTITYITNPSVPIPLKLLSFSVSRTQKNTAVAVWNTANEYNVKGYTLEMSGDGRNYQPLQFTNAKNQDYNDYREQFAIPSAEVLYFRLKMADKDGTITYSNVVVLREEKQNGFIILNNPVKGDIRLSILDNRLIGTEIKLINSQGSVLYKGRISGSSVTISTASYPAGVYMLSTETGTQKIVLAKN